MERVRVFIGFDHDETVAYHVLAHSIMRHARAPVAITSLCLGQLPISRGRAEYQSTAFSFSRFLVPYLCGYEGRAIFLDCDMLARADVAELLALHDSYRAVSVVKHEYAPKRGDKFLGYKQSLYAKKNWSSVMVFENALCRTLTPHVVDTASGLFLHQFKWLQDDSMIGGLPIEWNHLVGEYEPNPLAKLVHFTLGTPCFAAYARCEYAAEWHEEHGRMLDYNKIGEFSRVARTGT